MTTRPDPSSIRAQLDDLLADTSMRGRPFGRALAALVDGWLAGLLPERDGLAIVAVGGYGREELAPASDLDVVLLHDKRTDAASVADQIWYPIWDAGFSLDHSVRTVKEALSLADKDLKVGLGLLDARFVAGDRGLAHDLARGATSQWRDRAKRRLPLLEASVRTRHERFGPVAFELEPDLKEGDGGLRDVTVLRALAIALPAVDQTDDMLDAGELLFGVRVALQRISGRRDERLLLDYQDDVARALDRSDADELMRDVSQAGRTIAWHVDDAWRSVRAAIEGPRGRTRGGGDVVVADGIVIRDGELALTADARPATNPALIVLLADLSANRGATIARPTLRRLAAETPELPDPWPEGVRDALIGFLGAGSAAIPVFETLDRYGLVTRILPEWAAVRSKPQRNAFHRYTVDRHLVEASARAAALTRSVGRPDLLLVGALLHDLGKGYPGDHTEAGVVLVAEIATRMGFAPADVDALVDMVRFHLLLPSVATSRDLDDPDVVTAVAHQIGDQELLHLLAALTEADSLATGESAWSEWKAQLVAGLAERVARELAGLQPEPVATSLAADADLALRAVGGVLVEWDGRELAVVAPDEPRVFSRVVGVLALHGQGVRAASARSIPDGPAISRFELEPHFRSAPGPDVDALAADIREALQGELPIGDRLEQQSLRSGRLGRPTAAAAPDPRVVVDNAGSRTATIIEVRAPDAIGLLFRIAQVFADLDLDIRSARVATMGHEVVDTFCVATRGNMKVEDPGVLAQIEREILAALESGSF
ncbi:MAG: [protein-PII] uridylyltransferase [Acidimicrobiia bacterium]